MDNQSATPRNIASLAARAAAGLHSFDASVSLEQQERFAEILNSVSTNLEARIGLEAMGSDVSRPFACSRTGEVIHLVFPLTVQPGDMLGGLITYLSTQIPTCVIHMGDRGWTEPDWSGESRRHLSGIITALLGPPSSFASSSSPVDLARLAVWVNACSQALSIPGGVRDAVGAVLPSSIGGAKSASKYLTRVFSGLRGGITDEDVLTAINTLALLLKVWQRLQGPAALELVRKNRIGWGTVLLAGAPTAQKKVKKQDSMQTVLVSPSKPSSSPWLSTAERTKLAHLFSDVWSRPDSWRIEWNALTAWEQHDHYSEFVERLKSHYEELNRISSSVHSKLGQRKRWIYAVVTDSGNAPKSKKDKADPFKWSALFWKCDLNRLHNAVKKTFSPVTYLVDEKWQSLTVWSSLFNTGRDLNTIEAADFDDSDTPAWELWQIWASIFEPKFPSLPSQVGDSTSLADENMYAILAGSSEPA